MLELIFRGFLEWIYVLLVEIWGFIADGLLDIMGLDFAYLQAHIPIIPQISQAVTAAGWALLLGNLVFQALKSMAAGLGFEGEDPKLLFSRTFVFAFLLLASPQICRIGLDPAITGGPSRTLPGMPAYTVARTVAGNRPDKGRHRRRRWKSCACPPT